MAAAELSPGGFPKALTKGKRTKGVSAVVGAAGGSGRLSGADGAGAKEEVRFCRYWFPPTGGLGYREARLCRHRCTLRVT